MIKLIKPKDLAGILILILSIVFLGVPVGQAVEFQQENTEEAKVVYQDEGTKKIQEMQESTPPAYQAKDAEEQANKYVTDGNLKPGWNEDNKIYVDIGVAFFDSEDPSYDDTFIIRRSLKTMEATLDAKARIIEYISTNMSAMDQALTPGTDINAQFKEESDKVQRKLETQKQIVAKLLESSDKSEAEALRGATYGDRLNSLMDAAIKKLDETYSSEKIEEKKIKEYEKAKLRYQEAQKDYEVLQQKSEALIGAVTEKLQSKVMTISKMPLFGAVTVAQFESWNEKDEQYRIALVVLWSSKMERCTRAFISGEDFQVPPGSTTIREWINSQNWATASGGRRFRDNNGNVYFVGIAASPVGKSSSSEKRARGVSEQMAKKEVAMSIFSDVSSNKMADQIMETRSGGSGKDSSVAAETFAATLQQQIKDRQVNGLQKLYGKKVVHPISQQYIYVTIYGVSSNSAKQALLMQESTYLTKILDVKHQQRLKGASDAYKSKVERVEQDKSEYHKSKAATSDSIDDKEYGRGSSQSPGDKPVHDDQEGGKSRSGTYKGAGNGNLSW